MNNISKNILKISIGLGAVRFIYHLFISGNEFWQFAWFVLVLFDAIVLGMGEDSELS